MNKRLTLSNIFSSNKNHYEVIQKGSAKNPQIEEIDGKIIFHVKTAIW